MGTEYEEYEEERVISEGAAQRLVEWVIDHGHTKEEAYEALAFTVGAAVEKRGDD